MDVTFFVRLFLEDLFNFIRPSFKFLTINNLSIMREWFKVLYANSIDYISFYDIRCDPNLNEDRYYADFNS